jgi:hypothetical protein
MAMGRTHGTPRRPGVGAGLAALTAGLLFAAGGPAAALTDESAVAVSTSWGLEVAVQPDGAPASDWTVEKVDEAGPYDWSSPSLYRQSTGGLVMTAEYGDGSLWFWWQGPGATNWNREEVAGPDSACSAQPVVVSQAPLEAGQATDTAIVAENCGVNSGATIYWQVNGTPGWSAEALPTGTGLAIEPDASVAPDNTILVSYVATNPGTTSPSFGIDRFPFGSTSTSSVVTVQSGPSDLLDTSVIEQPSGGVIVGVTEYNGYTYFNWSPPGSLTTWWQETVTSQRSGYAQDFYYTVPMALTGDDSGVDIGTTNNAGTCDLAYYQANGATGWNQQTVGCTNVPSPEALAVQPTNHNEAAASADDNGNVYFYWQPDGTTTWNSEKIPGLTGGAVIYTVPALALD